MMEKGVYVKEIAENRPVEGLFVVRKGEVRKTRAGSVFWSVQLSDVSGVIEAKMWKPESSGLRELPREGCVLAVLKGKCDLYKDKPQINIEQARLLDEAEVKTLDLAWFRRTSSRSIEEMLRELISLCEQEFQYQPWADFVRSVFDDFNLRAAFCVCPGGISIHHAYQGGLLEHTLGVFRLCRFFADLYPGLDRETLLAGALFHDIGKIREYAADIEFSSTDEGRLFGHLTLGVGMLEPFLAQSALPSELILHLKHLILSHHGELAFGACVQPKTQEAFALHFADNLDARMAICHQAKAAQNESQEAFWTDPIFALDHQRLFCPRGTPGKERVSSLYSALGEVGGQRHKQEAQSDSFLSEALEAPSAQIDVRSTQTTDPFLPPKTDAEASPRASALPFEELLAREETEEDLRGNETLPEWEVSEKKDGTSKVELGGAQTKSFSHLLKDGGGREVANVSDLGKTDVGFAPERSISAAEEGRGAFSASPLAEALEKNSLPKEQESFAKYGDFSASSAKAVNLDTDEGSSLTESPQGAFEQKKGDTADAQKALLSREEEVRSAEEGSFSSETEDVADKHTEDAWNTNSQKLLTESEKIEHPHEESVSPETSSLIFGDAESLAEYQELDEIGDFSAFSLEEKAEDQGRGDAHSSFADEAGETEAFAKKAEEDPSKPSGDNPSGSMELLARDVSASLDVMVETVERTFGDPEASAVFQHSWEQFPDQHGLEALEDEQLPSAAHMLKEGKAEGGKDEGNREKLSEKLSEPFGGSDEGAMVSASSTNTPQLAEKTLDAAQTAPKRRTPHSSHDPKASESARSKPLSATSSSSSGRSIPQYRSALTQQSLLSFLQKDQ